MSLLECIEVNNIHIRMYLRHIEDEIPRVRNKEGQNPLSKQEPYSWHMIYVFPANKIMMSDILNEGNDLIKNREDRFMQSKYTRDQWRLILL